MRCFLIILVFILAYGSIKAQTAVQLEMGGISVSSDAGMFTRLDFQKHYRAQSRGFGVGYGFVTSVKGQSYHKVVVRYLGTLLNDPSDKRSMSTAKRGIVFYGIGAGPYIVTGGTSPGVKIGIEPSIEVRYKFKNKPRIVIPFGMMADYYFDLKVQNYREVYFGVFAGIRYFLQNPNHRGLPK